jgi:hypothetical protein
LSQEKHATFVCEPRGKTVKTVTTTTEQFIAPEGTPLAEMTPIPENPMWNLYVVGRAVVRVTLNHEQYLNLTEFIHRVEALATFVLAAWETGELRTVTTTVEIY